MLQFKHVLFVIRILSYFFLSSLSYYVESVTVSISHMLYFFPLKLLVTLFFWNLFSEHARCCNLHLFG